VCGRADVRVQGKIVQFHRLRREGRAKSINEKIRHARNFKNPYMLNWLVSHCGNHLLSCRTRTAHAAHAHAAQCGI
jgi:hypothetical protein